MLLPVARVRRRWGITASCDVVVRQRDCRVHRLDRVWKVLHRHGLSRRPRQPGDAVRRYEWPCQAALLHMGTARYARFERPGHRVTGDRSQSGRNWMADRARVGDVFARPIVDDYSRLAYVELLNDERAPTAAAR